MDRIGNKEIHEKIEKELCIRSYLKRRRSKLIGHNIRHPGMLVSLLEVKAEEKNWVSRQ